MSGSDRSWMYKRSMNGRLMIAFTEGVDDFVEFALSHPEVVSGGKIKCPCRRTSCQNSAYRDIDTVKTHLGQKGFVHKYEVWNHHGEKPVYAPIETLSSPRVVVENEIVHAGCSQMIHNLAGAEDITLGNSSAVDEEDHVEEESNPDAQIFFDMLESASKPLGSGVSKNWGRSRAIIVTQRLAEGSRKIGAIVEKKKADAPLGEELTIEQIDQVFLENNPPDKKLRIYGTSDAGEFVASSVKGMGPSSKKSQSHIQEEIKRMRAELMEEVDMLIKEREELRKDREDFNKDREWLANMMKRMESVGGVPPTLVPSCI